MSVTDEELNELLEWAYAPRNYEGTLSGIVLRLLDEVTSYRRQEQEVSEIHLPGANRLEVIRPGLDGRELVKYVDTPGMTILIQDDERTIKVIHQGDERMSEQQWREVTLDDLRGMTLDEQRTCRVRIGDVARGVYAVDGDGTIWTLHVGGTRDWTDHELDHWDAVIEAPVPPSRPVPTHEGAVIRLSYDDYLLTYVFQDGAWREPGNGESVATEVVQAEADMYGWVELVPAVGPDAEDARPAARGRR